MIQRFYASETKSEREAAGIIALEVVKHGKSSGWCGDISTLNAIIEILKPFNIVYVDDFNGSWSTFL